MECQKNARDGEIAVCLISKLLCYVFHRAATWPAESPGVLAGMHIAHFLCFYLVKNLNVVLLHKKFTEELISSG